MFPNLIYHRNMIDKSLISTDNLISQQQQQQLNNTKSEKNNNTNKKKIEIVPLIQRPEQEKQKTESSLFQLNSNLLNHLFLTSTATTSTTTSNNNTNSLANISTPFSNSIFNSFALQAAANSSLVQNSPMQFYSNPSINNNRGAQLPQINNVFAFNALAAHYNSTIQSQFITVKVFFNYPLTLKQLIKNLIIFRMINLYLYSLYKNQQ